MFDLARTMAPASLIRFTWNASLLDTNPWSASDPLALCRPMVSKLSLTIVGMQWSGPDGTVRLEAAIHLVRLRQRLRVRHDDGVDGGAVLVVGVDAAEILLDQAAAGDLSGFHRRVNAGHRGLVHLKRGWRLRQESRGQRDAGRRRHSQTHPSRHGAADSTAAAIHCNESLYASRRCSRTAARNTRAS